MPSCCLKIVLLIVFVHANALLDHVYAQGTFVHNRSRLVDIPLRLPNEAKIAVKSHSLEVGANTTARMDVLNRTGKRIVAISIVVSYLDEKGELLFTVPFLAGCQSASEMRVLSASSALVNLMKIPAEEGHTIHMVGMNLSIPTRLPSDSEVSAILIRFEEGELYSSVSHMWSTDELPSKSPPFSRLPDDMVSQNTWILLNGLVSSNGKLTNIVPDLGAVLSREQVRMVQVIQEIFEEWEFVPPTRQGWPVDREIFLLVRQGPKGTCGGPVSFSLRTGHLPKTLTLVELVQTDKEAEWFVCFGGVLSSGQFSRMVATTVEVP